MAFRVGEQVECIDAGGCTHLNKGSIYTVIGIAPSGYGDMIEVDCKPDWMGNRGYFASRFRPLVTRKTDISALKALLEPAKVRERV